MRCLFPIALTLAVSSSAAGAQSAQDHAKHQAAPKDTTKMNHMAGPWKEMNAFHTLLAATFHPAKEKKDLKPLREKSEQLAAASRTWAASTPPAACASDAVRSPIVSISVDALAIGNQVLASASDADLTLAITALHAKFEAVDKMCAPHDMKGMKHSTTG